MLGRFVCVLGASLLFAAACSGGAFSGTTDQGSGGSAGSSGGKGSGGKGSGGNKAQGGSDGQAGADGKAGAGGSTVNGGSNPGGGMVGISGNAGSMTGEAGALVSAPECFEPSDCDPSSACHEPTCQEGLCDEIHVPDGPFKLQVPGDCQRMDCLDGEEKLVVDSNDKDDLNECTIDSCSQNGAAMHKVRFGEVCANGAGTCSGAGKCELCNRDQCPDAIPCFAPICGGGSCQLAPRPAGDLCFHQSNKYPADTGGQCDGTGICVDCVTSGGCGECCACLDQGCIDA